MRKALLTLIPLLMGSSLGFGPRLSVVGTVTDETGAVIPGAGVTLTRKATNEVFAVLTGDTGDFVVTGLVG